MEWRRRLLLTLAFFVFLAYTYVIPTCGGNVRIAVYLRLTTVGSGGERARLRALFLRVTSSMQDESFVSRIAGLPIVPAILFPHTAAPIFSIAFFHHCGYNNRRRRNGKDEEIAAVQHGDF